MSTWRMRISGGHACIPKTSLRVEAEQVQLFEKGQHLAEYRFRKKDGSYCWVSDEQHLTRDAGGRPMEVVGSWSDIDSRKAAERAIQAAQAELEKANDAKSAFLANMSHEIRTPMNAVLGLSHLALKTDPSPRQRDYLIKIRNSGQHLLGIINEILDFSKIEAGKLTVENIEFDLDKVLENVSNLISEKASEKGLELVFDIEPSVVSSRLRGDPLRLGQILINFCNNAVKFTEEGEIVIRAQVLDVLEDSQVVKFSVCDTGIGMTDAQMERLFQAFEQADTSTTCKYGGTGLGLAISKRLAELMNGNVGVTSELGQGSTFWFTARLGKGAAVPRPNLLRSDLRGRRVLIIDDNSPARAVLSNMLTNMTFSADEAASGEEGIEMVRQAVKRGEPYEIVFVDWQMPSLDGIETSKRILALPDLAISPHLVMVTAYGREDVLKQAEKNGTRERTHQTRHFIDPLRHNRWGSPRRPRDERPCRSFSFVRDRSDARDTRAAGRRQRNQPGSRDWTARGCRDSSRFSREWRDCRPNVAAKRLRRRANGYADARDGRD